VTDPASSAQPAAPDPIGDQGGYGDDLVPELVAAAAAINRLGEALIAKQIEPAVAATIADAVGAMSDDLDGLPVVSKLDNLGRRNRIHQFIEHGVWPDPPPDGSRMEFDPASPIGGDLNPFSVGARYYRDGDEAVGRATIGRCFEGPPERVHGGMVCAIFDEVMGSVFRATGVASAFTGELSVRFVAPAPLGTELEFRARLVDSDGRKRFLAGEATGPDGVFATATATFIEMRPEHFAD